MIVTVRKLSGIIRNYQELSNLDQITTVMSDHNNLRVEINFKEKTKG